MAKPGTDRRHEFFGMKRELERLSRATGGRMVARPQYHTLPPETLVFVDASGTLFLRDKQGDWTVPLAQCVMLTSAQKPAKSGKTGKLGFE